MSRQEKAAMAGALRREGLTGRAIADRLGISTSYAFNLLCDPDGSRDKARKAGYGKPCVDCETPTSGHNGRAKAPERCKACRNAKRNSEARARAIAKFQAFAAEHGRAPTAEEWRVGAPIDTSNVQGIFGSWAAGLEAAGLEPKLRYAGDLPEVVEETVRLYRSGLSLAQVGERLGVSDQCVFHRLVSVGEPRRSWAEIRRLRQEAARVA